jgi:hypothetical protein
MVDKYSFNIEDFKKNFAAGGARPNLFRVQLDLMSNGEATLPGAPSETKLTFTCRAASIPAMTVGTIEVPYFGRKIKVAGDRTFAEWTVTILNDEDFSVRRALETWNNKINLHNENIRVVPYNIVADNPGSSYKRDASVVHYDKKGEVIARYKFIGMYPSEVSAIDLAWDTNDTIEEFTCTLMYDYFQTETDDPRPIL